MTAHAMKGDRERCLAAGMDDYVSKPIRASELSAAIERVVPHSKPDVPTAPRETQQADVVNWEEALAQVDGCENLLRHLAELFLAESTGWMSQLERGDRLSRRCPGQALAHTLKGSLGMFGAKAAFDVALELEAMGRTGDLTGCEATYAALETALQQVALVLARFPASGRVGADRG